MKVRTIIRTVEALYGGYVITYGKAWRAKQRAWKMIYGDSKDGYEQLLVLFNAIKAMNQACIMSTSQNLMHGRMGGRYFFVPSGAFLSVSRPLGTVIPSSLLMVRS